MKFYFVGDSDIAPYHNTLHAAKRNAQHIAENSYHDVTVDHVDIPTDRANILRLANIEGGTQMVLREAVYIARAKLKKDLRT